MWKRCDYPVPQVLMHVQNARKEHLLGNLRMQKNVRLSTLRRTYTDSRGTNNGRNPRNDKKTAPIGPYSRRGPIPRRIPHALRRVPVDARGSSALRPLPELSQPVEGTRPESTQQVPSLSLQHGALASPKQRPRTLQRNRAPRMSSKRECLSCGRPQDGRRLRKRCQGCDLTFCGRRACRALHRALCSHPPPPPPRSWRRRRAAALSNLSQDAQQTLNFAPHGPDTPPPTETTHS